MIDQITKLPEDILQFVQNLKYQNYHRHSSYSNPSTPDSGTVNEDYAKRAKELGHGILSSCEHGYQGNYWEVYRLAEEYNLKFIFGAEAYWVKDRFQEDRSNNHICLFAKNEEGRQAINDILSEANITGYYYKPRVDLELLLSLPADDVFVTSACIAFYNYGFEETDKIIERLHNHFGDNFMLEVQAHNVEKQKELNRHIVELSRKLNISLIMGCDSHYIYPEQDYDRDFILEYKHIKYEEEEGFYLDYPDTETVYKRFKEQGVLTDLEILNAINNTNIFLLFSDILLNRDIKLPTLFKDLTQKQKNEKYKKIITTEAAKYFEKYNIKGKERTKYLVEIAKEVKTVIDTGMADYFLLDYYMVKKAKEYGGIVTKSGRGSCVSFITNTLLGFSNIDRIIAPVHLFPERFMSTTRILETKSLPDIDLNTGTPEIMEKAQRELLGEGHSYPMVAFGTLKVKSAWKMYAGANTDKIDFETANEISKSLTKYEKDLAHADEDEKDTIDVYDYIDPKYHKLFDESEKYRGIIMDKKKHPCGHLIYSGDIRKEIGLIKCKSESTKKEYIVALIDGASADYFKFLKNDLLKVDVCLLHKMTADRIGIEEPTVRELIAKCNSEEGKAVWDIYANGYTLGVNQCEKSSTTRKVMKYKPTNDGELACFIAAIRPSFKSMYATFERREKFNYGIPAFDNVVQTDTIKDSYLFFQEQIMSALAFSGIPMGECYSLIKAISKKKTKFILSYKEQFLKGFKAEILKTEEIEEELAQSQAEKVWTIIENAARYGFNASHAYCMACDSLRDAHDKCFYPYEFYEVRLNYFSEKGKKDKVAGFKQEMKKAFGISEGEYRFGLDNRKFTADKENHKINPSLLSIKGIGQRDADELYELGKNTYNDFVELYSDIKKKTKVDTGKMTTLIKIGYFKDFGKSAKLLKVMEIYNNLSERKQFKKDALNELGLTYELVKKYAKKETEKILKEVDINGMISELIKNIPDTDIFIKDKLATEMEVLGFPLTKTKSSNLYYAIGIKTYKNSRSITRYFDFYNIKTGEMVKFKISDAVKFAENEIKEGSIVKINSSHTEPKRTKVNGKWIKDKTEKNNIIDDWTVF